MHERVKYPCKICRFKASSSGSLKVHTKLLHKDKEVIYKCTNCNKEYKSRDSLYVHNRSEHEMKKYNCNMCEYSAKQKSNLSTHIKAVHFDERYLCKLCDFRSSTKKYLTYHVKRMHERNDVINCSDCNKTMTVGSLKRHRKLLHTLKQTQFSCNLCTFQTIYRESVQKHINAVHMVSK